MFTCCDLTPSRPSRDPSASPVRRSAASTNIRKLDMNSTLEIMSFLDQTDILRFGAVSREYYDLSRHPSLWRHIKIKDADSLNIPGLAHLISLTTEKMPLNSISLSGPLTTGCYCRESRLCGGCASADRCTSSSTCSACESLCPVEVQLKTLSSFFIHNVKFLTSCPFNTMLRYCGNLKKLDILNDLDVNLVIAGLASNCPLLTDIRFKYSHALDFDADFRQSHPLLRPQVAEFFVSSCPRVKHISFCHYTVDEDCARCLLELENITEADFSDNENLSGAFLMALPTKWVSLRKLVMRDCTELDNDYVQTFASMLLQNYGGMLKYCQHLSVADFSCQWAFHGDSLVGSGTHAALNAVRSRFRWREDQCEVPGFGIDPEFGIDGIDGIEDEVGAFDFTMEEIFSDSDMSDTSAALNEALSHSIHHHHSNNSSSSRAQTASPPQQVV